MKKNEIKKAIVNLNTEENANKILELAKQICTEHAVLTQNVKDEYCIEIFSSKKVERSQVWICKRHVDIYVSANCDMYNLLNETEQYKRSSNIDTKQRFRAYTSIDDMISLLQSYIDSKAVKTTKKRVTTKKVNKKVSASA